MFFQRKPGKTHPRVCVYYFDNNKQVQVPRHLTKHLDDKPDIMVEEWMTWYAAVNALSAKAVRVDLGSELEDLLKLWRLYLKSRQLNPVTVRLHLDCVRLALPLFRETEMNSWYLLSGELYEYLLKTGINAYRHKRVNQSFGSFYKWLQRTNKIKHRHGLLLENRPLEEAKTPLRFTLTPEDVLEYAASCQVPELKFVALAGYFFSLRTSEVFGVRRQDFLAGKQVLTFECYKVMAKAGLFGKLLINVRNCRRPNGTEYLPSKRKKGGLVGCFDQRAAEVLVKLLKPLEPGLVVSKHLPEHWSKQWKLHGIPGVTIKDLRRASLYWLGHYSDLPFVALKNHARHSNTETTALYVRRPEEEFTEDMELDLDA